MVGFLNHLVTLLKQHPEKIGRGRHLAIESRYVQALAAIWRRHGLESKVGLAFDFLLGKNGKNVESAFQRFGRLALAAVGDRVEHLAMAGREVQIASEKIVGQAAKSLKS